MERVRHIADTQQPHTYEDETHHVREELPQAENYDHTGEAHPDQIRVRKYLEEIDEDVLAEIFFEYIRKSGTDEETVNWIPFNQIQIIYKTPEEEKADPSPLGSYDVDNEIRLYAHKTHSPTETLFVVIHEQLHAISAHHSETEAAHTFWNTTITGKLQTGIDTTTLQSTRSMADAINKLHSEKIQKQESGEKPNEGLTEFITQEIFRKYATHSGEHDTEDTYEEMMTGGYFQNQLSIELYIRTLAMISQVPLETVKDGVIRTYLRNGNILPADLQVELRQAGALKKITSLLEETDVTKITDIVADLCAAGLIEKQDASELLAIYTGAQNDRADFYNKTE